MTAPSKELVGAVLNTEVTQVSVEDNKIKYNTHYVINIHEFTMLCKEFAFIESFHIKSFKESNNRWLTDLNHGWEYAEFEDVTEPGAVIKATEWVLTKRIK